MSTDQIQRIEKSFDFSVSKVDVEKRQIFGWISVCEKNGVLVEDSQGDVIEPGEMEPAVYSFNLHSRKGADQHQVMNTSRLIESMFFSKEKQDLLGIDLGMVGWWGGFQVDDSGSWGRVKSGDRLQFSWGGAGYRKPMGMALAP